MQVSPLKYRWNWWLVSNQYIMVKVTRHHSFEQILLDASSTSIHRIRLCAISLEQMILFANWIKWAVVEKSYMTRNCGWPLGNADLRRALGWQPASKWMGACFPAATVQWVLPMTPGSLEVDHSVVRPLWRPKPWLIPGLQCDKLLVQRTQLSCAWTNVTQKLWDDKLLLSQATNYVVICYTA